MNTSHSTAESDRPAAGLRARIAALRKDVLTLWFAMRHPATPRAAKLLAAFTAAYALSPVDLIPDFIPVLGLLDDLILVPLLVAATVRMVPEAVLNECRAQAEAYLAAGRGKPVSRWGLALMLMIWMLALWLAWQAWQVFFKVGAA